MVEIALEFYSQVDLFRVLMGLVQPTFDGRRALAVINICVTSLGEPSSLVVLHVLAFAALFLHHHSHATFIAQVGRVFMRLLVLHLS